MLHAGCLVTSQSSFRNDATSRFYLSFRNSAKLGIDTLQILYLCIQWLTEHAYDLKRALFWRARLGLSWWPVSALVSAPSLHMEPAAPAAGASDVDLELALEIHRQLNGVGRRSRLHPVATTVTPRNKEAPPKRHLSSIASSSSEDDAPSSARKRAKTARVKGASGAWMEDARRGWCLVTLCFARAASCCLFISYYSSKLYPEQLRDHLFSSCSRRAQVCKVLSSDFSTRRAFSDARLPPLLSPPAPPPRLRPLARARALQRGRGATARAPAALGGAHDLQLGHKSKFPSSWPHQVLLGRRTLVRAASPRRAGQQSHAGGGPGPGARPGRPCRSVPGQAVGSGRRPRLRGGGEHQRGGHARARPGGLERRRRKGGARLREVHAGGGGSRRQEGQGRGQGGRLTQREAGKVAGVADGRR